LRQTDDREFRGGVGGKVGLPRRPSQDAKLTTAPRWRATMSGTTARVT
jgi:hypothetical protein